MLSNDYELYIKSVLDLTRSLVIKSTQTIDTINTYLNKLGLPISEDETLWKYYRNIEGNYFHPWFVAASGATNRDDSHVWVNNVYDNLGTTYGTLTTAPARAAFFDALKAEIAAYDDEDPTTEITRDQFMWINSLDNEEEILFHKDILSYHPLTLSEYRLEGEWYHRLVESYPGQEELIRRILRPVDQAEAINSDDYTILQFDESLVKSNEVFLIAKLQTWIKQYVARWDNPSFSFTDSLYPAANLALLYLAIPNAIVNLRLANCKTSEAHTYHIWKYLAGYSRLDRFKDRIYHGQALWLYRNIEYIVRNAGRKSTLDFLNEGFARPYGLELSVYDLRQDSTLLQTELKKELRISRTPYESEAITDNSAFVITPRDVLEKLKVYGLLNPDNIDVDEETLREAVLQSTDSSITTGVIEVNVNDVTNRGIVNAIGEKFHQWFYLAGNGLFPYKFTINLPGQDPVPFIVSAAEAAVIVLYCAARFQDPNGTAIPTNIPEIGVREIMHTPEETEEQIRSIVENQYIWDERFDEFARDIIDPIQVNDVPEFLEHVNNVLKRRLIHEFYLSKEATADGQGQLRALLGVFYKDEMVTLTPHATFDDFFNDLQIDISNLSQADYGLLALEITKHIVGFADVEEGLPSPYYEMMQILRILSSYTVAFVVGDGNNLLEAIDYPFLYATSNAGEMVDGTPLDPFGTTLYQGSTLLNLTQEDTLNLGFDDVSMGELEYSQRVYFGVEGDRGDVYLGQDLDPKESMVLGGIIDHQLIWDNLEGVDIVMGEECYDPRVLFSSNENGVLYDAKISIHRQTDINSALAAEGTQAGWVQDISGNDIHWEQPTSAWRPIWNKNDGLHGVDTLMPGGTFPVPIDGYNDSYSVWAIVKTDLTDPNTPFASFIGGRFMTNDELAEFDFTGWPGGTTQWESEEPDNLILKDFRTNRAHTLSFGTSFSNSSQAIFGGTVYRMRGRGPTVGTNFDTAYTAGEPLDRLYPFAPLPAASRNNFARGIWENLDPTPYRGATFLIGYTVSRTGFDQGSMQLIIPAIIGTPVENINNFGYRSPDIYTVDILKHFLHWPNDSRNSSSYVMNCGVIDRVLTEQEWVDLHNYCVACYGGIGVEITNLPLPGVPGGS